MLTPKPRRIRRRTGPSSIQRAHRAHRAQRIRRLPAAAALTTAALALAGCSLGAGPSDDATDPGPDPAPQVVQVVTHDSFAVSEDLIADFEAETGYTVELSAPGDGGSLVNQLILTRDAPLGDVAYGVDNTFASRALEEDVFAAYDSPELPASAEEYRIDDGADLMPIDVGDVCLNIDTEWFQDNDLDQPETLADLTEPAYADLMVVTHPANSSPGLAFLAATVGEFGSDWEQYWADLNDNGLLVVDSWSTAYSEEFSGSVGEGPRPIALSYSTSPAFEIDDDGQVSTEAMMQSCLRQVEYAGVLAGAENTDGGQAFIDFLLSDEVQADIPDQMFMYPVNDEIDLPTEWVQWAPLADDPIEVDPGEIDTNREEWIQTWSEIVVG
ncbi:MAG TPA: thiamine ABC transporter substrate-binding protein [Beutenbergiaceae bacterium]|nr:thiamine ABC transporter substrate-binding protein [Beutenbergiaceae bacterium]